MFTSFPLSLSHTTQTTVQVQRRQLTTSDNRRPSACHRTSGTCGYYSSCLEPQFRCGSSGFILQYAQKRCEAARTFAGCSNCITNEEIVSWSNKVETCIQSGLQNLIISDFTRIESDPVTCLSFEQKAIEKINECYRNPEGRSNNDRPELCQLLGNGISDFERQDLSTLVSAFNVGGHYHESTVDSGIPELVRQCGHSEVADSLYVGRPTYRLIFCMWAYYIGSQITTPGRSVESDLYVNFLSRQLNDSESHFQYGGSNMHSLCKSSTPHSAQVTEDRYDFHIVTWFASPNNTLAQNWNKVTADNDNNGKIIAGYYEFTHDLSDYLPNRVRDYSKCGNGKRDPGEMCDYAMLDSSMCTLDCNIQQPLNESEGIYECSVDRLNKSYCWVQTCGDGKKTSGEECDDGNLDNNDGCSSQCRIEPQCLCKNRYNQTSICRPLPPVVATQQQNTRSNIVQTGRTESTQIPSVIVDMPLDARGLSSARRLISRTELVLLTVLLTTLWTTLTLV